MEIDKETYEGILPCLKDSDVQHLVVNMKTNYMRWRMWEQINTWRKCCHENANIAYVSILLENNNC